MGHQDFRLEWIAPESHNLNFFSPANEKFLADKSMQTPFPKEQNYSHFPTTLS
jgi:hypothetical protein